MLSGQLILNVLAIVAFETTGQIFIKTFYEEDNRKLYLFFLGWLMYLFALYFLFRSYSYTNFAIANGIWNALSTVLVGLIGFFYYGEHLTKYEIAGLGLVVFGFVIIGAFSDGGAAANKK